MTETQTDMMQPIAGDAGSRNRKRFWRSWSWPKRIGISATAMVLLAHIYVFVLGILPSPQTHTMRQRVSAGETLQKTNVPLEDISPYLIAAVIAAEDARFCAHNGIDREAIEKAIAHNKKGGRRRGGSTITQQTSKNLFFWNGGGMARKVGEAYGAVLIEMFWPKRRILEHYLNIAEWGDGIFGAEAAAQNRFGKSAGELSNYEAALLASVLPSPNKWRIDPPGKYVMARARTINARLNVTVREGFGDCVLKGHPAFDRKDFSAPKAKTLVVKSEDKPDAIAEVSQAVPPNIDQGEKFTPTDEPLTPAETPSLEEVLAQAEIAAEATRKGADELTAANSNAGE